VKNICVKLKPLVKGINRVVVLKTAILPGEEIERLFFATQIGEIFYLKDGDVIPFLDIKDSIIKIDKTEERGFYGLAFHPNFHYNGLFYLHYGVVGTEGKDPLSSFTPNPDKKETLNLKWENREINYNHIHTVEEWIYKVDSKPSKRRTLLNIRRPFGNHNGFNSLNFSAENNRLVLTTGDGGLGYDPFNLSQDINEIAGKIIEIDVSNFVDNKVVTSRFEELPNDVIPLLTIIAKGVRNISGIIYQKLSNHYIKYIANVGQRLVESVYAFIHYQQVPVREVVNEGEVNQSGLINFGWRGWEGDFPTTLEKGITYYNEALEILPKQISSIVSYFHEDKREDKFLGTAITGVRPYLGNEINDLTGTIIFSDLKNKKEDSKKGVLAYTKLGMNDYEVIDVDYDFGEEDTYFVGLGSNREHTKLFLTTYTTNTMKDKNKGAIFKITN